jgi:hypothetical protein
VSECVCVCVSVCLSGTRTHKTANGYGIRAVDVKMDALSVHLVTSVSTEYDPFCFRTCSNCSKKNRKTDPSEQGMQI